MKRILVCIICLLGILAIAPPANTPAAAQAGGQCTSETFERANIGRTEIENYEMKQADGKTVFVLKGMVKTATLPASAQVLACGGYAKLTHNGQDYYFKRSAYRVACTCDAATKRDAAVPGVGNARMCPASQCPATR
jgi:hypothetical protein